MAEIVIFDGYVTPKFSRSNNKRSSTVARRTKRRSSKRRSSKKMNAHQRRFGAASKACKGLSRTARHACIRNKLK